MYTGKVDHRFSDTVSLTGFYLYNKSDEPCANYWEPGLSGENRFADPGDYLLKRRVHVLALNNTWLPSNNTVVTLRYGMTDFVDDDTLSIEFDPATLGFSQTFLDQMQLREVPADPRHRLRQRRLRPHDGRDRPDRPHLLLVERQRRGDASWSAATPSRSAPTSASSASTSSRSRTRRATSASTASTPRATRWPTTPATATASPACCSGTRRVSPGRRARISRLEPARGLHPLLRRSTRRTTSASTRS